MKTIITILAVTLSISSASAHNNSDIPLVKYVSVQEDLINPFESDIDLRDLKDTIREDQQITESEIAAETNIDQVIAEDIKITEAVLPVYQPLDWGRILGWRRIVKPVLHMDTNL